MTQEQIIWSFGISIVASLVVGMFLQRFIEKAGSKFFAWTLSLNAFRRKRFYMRVAQRNTSYTTVIGYIVTTMFGTIGVQKLQNHPYWVVFLFAMTMWALAGYVMSILSLTTIEGFIRRYDFLRALVRPGVDELFLISLDSQFANIETKADYDAVIDALTIARRTHPRST